MNRIQRRNQRLVRNALGRRRLITSITVSSECRITIDSLDWEDYWGNCDVLAEEIGRLKIAWTALIDGNYAACWQCAFVHAYFTLLRVCLEKYAQGEINLDLLKRVTAFETFQMSRQDGALAAGIFSARNPAYLLSRLANPKARDDPKYLPLICPLGTSAEGSRLYCHYRRISIVGTAGIQLFVYAPVAGHNQPLSYSLIGQLFSLLTPRVDPWVQERSRSLFHGIFGNIVARSRTNRLRLLDIACGSAKISMTLCKNAFAAHRKAFDVTLVDVVHSHKSIAPTFYRNPAVFGNVVFHRDNLFEWVDEAGSATVVSFDVALLTLR